MNRNRKDRTHAARRRHTVLLCLAVVNLGLLLAVAHTLGLRLNVTPSLPRGVYQAVPGVWTRDDIVELCLPKHIAQTAMARGYLLRSRRCEGHAPVIKKIVAVAGDRVSVGDDVSVNGVHINNSQLQSNDTNGIRLTRAAGEVVPDHKAWVMSTSSVDSFDSRYFGSVDHALIRTRLIPLWTF